ncbi:hypothetical protein P8C59_005032 [Phyllachora maydis]|uniref:Uncharacterized protein n=1 Tax=Phyllachora maydis TaxID=1825666 RepID=A0AAD9MBU8_9PEZI|nr:hypothetical protein P8C59_005032 [Phyllachora maydis]
MSVSHLPEDVGANDGLAVNLKHLPDATDAYRLSAGHDLFDMSEGIEGSLKGQDAKLERNSVQRDGEASVLNFNTFRDVGSLLRRCFLSRHIHNSRLLLPFIAEKKSRPSILIGM